MGKMEIYMCKSCSKYTFPKKYFCSNCGSIDYDLVEAGSGIVKEISLINHMLGQKDWKPRNIANVETNLGICITVGIEDNIEIGDLVTLSLDNGVPIGKRSR
ncbi:MAG: hypothetical protein ISQ22_05370 [Rhizobiales bacterium]|nr:hypothetical protein [Hyphomicrobiales bacterium]MBL6770779.1 hypothetical protein [Hyphomicrobiales bacterium]